MPSILSNSTAIHAKLRQMFSLQTRSKRRVILVAYVGSHAPSLLPDAKGVEIYCWPQAGATDPKAIRLLLAAGAKVFFVSSLHMKLYWVEGVGAIIASANLSKNALGEGGLHEVGVFLEDSTSVDVDALISGLAARPVTKELLDLLDRQTNVFPPQFTPHVPALKTPTLRQWLDDPLRSNWKLGWTDAGDVPLSRGVLDWVQSEHAQSTVRWCCCCKKTDFERGDWALAFELCNGKAPSSFAWQLVQHIAPIASDEPAYSPTYPCQAVQAVLPARGTSAPFRLDTRAKSALRAVITRYGHTAIKRLRVPAPSTKFLALLREELNSLENPAI